MKLSKLLSVLTEISEEQQEDPEVELGFESSKFPIEHVWKSIEGTVYIESNDG